VRLVLDASAAVAVALGSGKGAHFAGAIEEADVVLAPDLFVAEVVNAIWKYHHFEHLDVDTCDRTIQLALGLVDDFVPCRDLHKEAFLLARAARRPAYDMFYLALARREDAIFLTVDNSLMKEAGRQGIRTAAW
jgi:predicted nucleic acid-binding protein